MDDRIFIDPTTFDPIDLYTIILVNNSQSFIGWGIKADTDSNYNHVMIQRLLFFVDSQDFLFHIVPMSTYMIKSNILKFWKINNLTNEEWQILDNAVLIDLSAPWWKRMYDFLGIMGQALHLGWISTPGLYFCSKRTAKYLRLLPRFDSILPKNVSPGFEDNFFIAHPELMTCLGYWWQD